jgi:ATP-dependent DNA helicase RecG
LFKQLGVETLEEMLLFVPFRYEDRTALKPIASLQPGADQTILAEVKAVSLIETRFKRMKIADLTVSDNTGILHAKWFNQPYLAELFKSGDRVMLSGKVQINNYGGRHLEMAAPQYEKVDEDEQTIHVGCIVPIYHETKGISSRQIRALMRRALNQYAARIPELLPDAILQTRLRQGTFCALHEALCEIHFPKAGSDLSLLNAGKSPAHQRLAFDELFALEAGLALRKKGQASQPTGIAFQVTDLTDLEALRRLLPFSLTPAQERVFAEISADMALPYPMHRLIQGDVGCGKTLVALMSILIAIENGFQAALMAPTEILAEQHFLSLRGHLSALGHAVCTLTSDMKARDRTDALAKIASGEVALVIGTHALIQEGVKFHKLGLVVVDEQHKFGVLQRARLTQKGYHPDTLIMTATPIPRTLALTLYGDLDISVIDELPPGRATIQTRLFRGKRREQAYPCVEAELARGRQAYIVCPLVSESEKVDLKAAIALSELLKKETFPHRRVGLLHGQMKREEKERTMGEFKAGLLDILVATTVIEVGIDVPNATVMLIEHAERFGLSQLHQLRGRVGRGSERSYCLLVAADPLSEEARRRLSAMLESRDGFALSEADLAIRGPGEFFGTRQSGIPALRVANLLRDADLLESAREAAFEWVDRDPALQSVESRPLRSYLENRWGDGIEALMVG